MRVAPLAAAALSGALATSAPAASDDPTTPARAVVQINVPGADPSDWLAVEIHPAADGTGRTLWAIEGCISRSAGRCAVSHAVTLSAEQSAAYARAWDDVLAMPVCKPAGAQPHTRPFTIDGWGPAAPADNPGPPRSVGHWAGVLPDDVAKVGSTPRTGRCDAPARLAVWVAQRFGALP